MRYIDLPDRSQHFTQLNLTLEAGSCQIWARSNNAISGDTVNKPPPLAKYALNKRGVYYHFRIKITSMVHFWARLRRYYCSNYFNYPDYSTIINVSKVITVVIAPQARPKIRFLTTSNPILSITHSNSFNYIDYC